MGFELSIKVHFSSVENKHQNLILVAYASVLVNSSQCIRYSCANVNVIQATIHSSTTANGANRQKQYSRVPNVTRKMFSNISHRQ